MRPTRNRDPGKPQESCSRSYRAVNSSRRLHLRGSTSTCQTRRALSTSAPAATSTSTTCLSLCRTRRQRKCQSRRAMATTIPSRASRARKSEACTSATSSCRMRFQTPRLTTRGRTTVASRDSVRATTTQTSKSTSARINHYRSLGNILIRFSTRRQKFRNTSSRNLRCTSRTAMKNASISKNTRK